jgi:hypothetical protein
MTPERDSNSARAELDHSRSMDHFLGLGFFVHPLPALAVAVLVINDQILKPNYPSWLTGKLSDFAGLFFFPLFVCAVVCLLWNLVSARFHWIGPRLLSIALFVTGLGFALLKLSRPVREWFIGAHEVVGLRAHVTPDPTDLMALIVLPFVYFFARRFWRTS